MLITNSRKYCRRAEKSEARESAVVMLDMVGLVRVTERHADSFDLRLAEILEHERLDASLGFDSLIKIAAPPIGTQLARPNDENVATNHFNPFHKSHLPNIGMAAGAGGTEINYLAQSRQ
jgi:hypothetical protein